MKSNFSFSVLTSIILLAGVSAHAATSRNAIPCTFDSSKMCTLQRDLLNDIGPNNLKYYGATNFDHRSSSEINVYNSALVQPYQDNVNAPGQIKLLLKQNAGNPPFLTGEIMTRANLRAWPINSPTDINPWTTKELTHGYLEVVAKLPKCDESTDGACQKGSADTSYNKGLWPAIWMMPTYDAEWPKNGEIDLMEAYLNNTDFKKYTIFLHFKGNDSRCGWSDCVGVGYSLLYPKDSLQTSSLLYDQFNTWGFEWQPDPNSQDGGQLITTYLNGQVTAGPIKTDDLPADGKGALSRGFNDPNGGYYLIVNLAVGGAYAGPPHPNLTTASMYIQSIKAYNVGGGVAPGASCQAPYNIQQIVSSDKRQITFAWEAPKNSDTITGYQINDWQNAPLWKSTDPKQRYFQDQSLPGTVGSFTYNFYTNCSSGTSKVTVYKAQVN